MRLGLSIKIKGIEITLHPHLASNIVMSTVHLHSTPKKPSTCNLFKPTQLSNTENPKKMSSNPATEKPLEILPRDTTTSVPTPITNEIASTINQPSGIADNMNDHAPSEKTPATEESSEVKISNAVESIRDENDNPGGDHIRTSQPIDTPKDLVDSVTSNPELAGPAVDKKASTTQPSSSVEKSDIKASSDGDVNDEHPRASIEWYKKACTTVNVPLKG